MNNNSYVKDHFRFRVNWRVFLIVTVILSIIIPAIPQIPTINPENRYVGVDTFWYVVWTNPSSIQPLKILFIMHL